MAKCMKCGKELLPDEIGLHKKIVGKGATEFMCLPCLAVYFDCSEELLYQKIEQFKKMGCMLFAPER